MQRFLAFVVTESLAGRAHRLKEYTIGVEAFDRPEAFSPVEDPIVRVEARRLRDKLAQYYQQSGRLDEVVIEVPRGRYVPSFSFRCDDNGCRFTQTVLTIEPFTATGDQGDAFREALIHELVDQLVRVRGFPVNIGPEPVHSCLALTGCIQILPTGVRVIAQLVTAPQLFCVWSTVVKRASSTAAVTSIAAAISSRVAAHLDRERVSAGNTRVLRAC